MKFLPFIVKNLLRNRRRTFLTLSSLAISICLLGVVSALYYALFVASAPPDQQLRVVTRHKVSIVFTMPFHYRDKIRAVPGVREVVTWQWYGGAYKDEESNRARFFPRIAAEAESLFRVYPEWRIPEDQKQAFISDRSGCILGAALARREGLKIGDKVVVRGTIFPFDLDLTVRGIYESDSQDENLWFQFKYFEEGLKKLGWPLFAGTFTMLADSPESIPRVAKTIDAMFANSEAPTRSESEYAFGLSFLSFLGNVKLILISICGAVTFTILLVAANTMAMSVRERVREVGILKTLGFTTNGILAILVLESVTLSLLGAVAGYVMAQGLCGVLRSGPAIVEQTRYLTVQPPVAALLAAAAVVIGALSSAIPAWNAARTSILEALRFTD
jgi:putative ABC transport system permease protein